MRSIIHAAVPEAKEVISYQIPYFNLNGPILYFSAYTQHIGIAAPPPTMKVFAEELTAYKTSVSTFQVPHDQKIPAALIRKIAQHRADKNAKNAKS